jgi:cytochrome c oxidase cbb3-type subunit 3
LTLLAALVFLLGCYPNPAPPGLTPIPTLAPPEALIPVADLGVQPVATTESGGEAKATEAPAGDAQAGATVFTTFCQACHGEGAAGGAVGPSLVRDEIKSNPDDFYRTTIANGRAGTAMTAWAGLLTEQQITDVIAFIRSKQ